jgi:hypothetical protein
MVVYNLGVVLMTSLLHLGYDLILELWEELFCGVPPREIPIRDVGSCMPLPWRLIYQIPGTSRTVPGSRLPVIENLIQE